MGEKYEFDSSTGRFTLKGSDETTSETTYIPLSNDLIGAYTCGTSNVLVTDGKCGTIYKVTSVDISNNSITGTQITYKNTGSFESEHGL